jgi:hypothetical protein
VEKTLGEQIHDVIETLLLAKFQSERVKQTMREKRLSFGLDFNYLDDDIMQIINKLRYMQHLAERHE